MKNCNEKQNTYIFSLHNALYQSANSCARKLQSKFGHTQSNNSSESMPLGGGDIGLNVWVEKGDLYFYFSRSGTFDEHNTLLKLGRVKVTFNA